MQMWVPACALSAFSLRQSLKHANLRFIFTPVRFTTLTPFYRRFNENDMRNDSWKASIRIDFLTSYEYSMDPEDSR